MLTDLIFRKIDEPWAVERMRQIYSETMSSLATHPIPERGPISQQEWWKSLDQSKVQAFLYAPINRPWEFIAFSIVQKKHEHFTTPIFAITPKEHGKGYGEQILRHYLFVANGPLAGEDSLSNPAIAHLNDRNGWQVLGIDEKGVRKLYHPGYRDLSEEQQQVAYDEIVRYHGYGKEN